MSVLPTNIHALLGCTATEEQVATYIRQTVGDAAEPDSIKVYSDITYYNYNDKGVSLQFKPCNQYKPTKNPNVKRADLQEDLMILAAVDLYADKYTGFPITLTYPTPATLDAPDAVRAEASLSTMELTKDTTGEELVKNLGEPDRKGGGESKSVGVWLEWLGLGIMCEFTSIHGAGRWDKTNGAGSAPVGIWTFFEPGQVSGQDTEDG